MCAQYFSFFESSLAIIETTILIFQMHYNRIIDECNLAKFLVHKMTLAYNQKDKRILLNGAGKHFYFIFNIVVMSLLTNLIKFIVVLKMC